MKENLVYLYNGNFNSLLNLLYLLLRFKNKPLDICAKEKYKPSLLEDSVELELSDDFDENKINVSSNIIKIIQYVYLSNDEHKELIIYYFLLNAMKYKEKIFYMRNLKCVANTLKIAKHVSNECHKLKGFLRFQEMKNHILYAEISPDNNVLELLSCHFLKRLKKERWIIKDTKRNMYSIYDTKKYYIVSGENINLKDINYDESEKEIANLWISFFKTIGIEARKNKRCQMNFMPKKYWRYIIEMRNEYEKGNSG